MTSTRQPFVLFDDAGAGASKTARLYADPVGEVRASAPGDVAGAFEALRRAGAAGLHAAGWMAYEMGCALEPRLTPILDARPGPLMWFGLFRGYAELDAAGVQEFLPHPHGAYATRPRPRIDRRCYDELIARTLAYIRAGDVYQINLTFQNDLELFGDPLALYAQIRGAGAGGWGGVVFDGDTWLLSTSPEMFFTLREGVIEARPMKGTARRGASESADAEAKRLLAADPKQIAENVMIVDLLRNDISRVAARGSVSAPHLFSVETYPTLHALTSTVRAKLADGRDTIDLIRALFPCGSVTGAPKIRAMQIIDELEADARGAYTGSMGWIAPNGDAAFNVMIRTIAAPAGDHRATLGVGSGIVLDSTPEGEWDECLAKTAFLSKNRPAFSLIETMRFEPETGIALVDLHMARLSASARDLGFNLELEALRARLQREVAARASPCVVRLALAADGAVEIGTRAIPRYAHDPVIVAPTRLPVARTDFRLRHKTSLRAFYDDARAAAQAEEVIFVDQAGFVTEGSITNVFVARGGVLLTPPAQRGLLPGVLRVSLLASGRAVEQDLRLADLAEGFFIGNAVRGLVDARLAAPECV